MSPVRPVFRLVAVLFVNELLRRLLSSGIPFARLLAHRDRLLAGQFSIEKSRVLSAAEPASRHLFGLGKARSEVANEFPADVEGLPHGRTVERSV
mgnify:CR=1 FL=1